MKEPDCAQEAKAESLARRIFAGILDRSGNKAILHVQRVAEVGADSEERTTGWLHDLVEDTDTRLDDLRREGFDPRIIDAVDRLTRRRDETYRSYIERVADDDLATRVKINDLRDNRRRCGALPKQEGKSLAKRYAAALARLGAGNARSGPIDD